MLTRGEELKMLEEMMVKNCAPTLAGIKVGSLFNCNCLSGQDVFDRIRVLNRRLLSHGIRIIPLTSSCNSTLIYVYRPDKLTWYLAQDDVKAILADLGYPAEDADLCVRTLADRLYEQDSFPHEIGLFLGYPAEDVKGFIENHARGCKCTGCWKVYGDEKAAQELFAKYRKCTDIYCRLYKRGSSLEKLTMTA